DHDLHDRRTGGGPAVPRGVRVGAVLRVRSGEAAGAAGRGAQHPPAGRHFQVARQRVRQLRDAGRCDPEQHAVGQPPGARNDPVLPPRAQMDPGAGRQARGEYEPYGKLLNAPLESGPGYTGHDTDPDTQYVSMQQRYYDPRVGRFWSVDPVTVDSAGGNFNRYWYANNNPYRFKDPD